MDLQGYLPSYLSDISRYRAINFRLWLAALNLVAMLTSRGCDAARLFCQDDVVQTIYADEEPRISHYIFPEPQYYIMDMSSRCEWRIRTRAGMPRVLAIEVISKSHLRSRRRRSRLSMKNQDPLEEATFTIQTDFYQNCTNSKKTVKIVRLQSGTFRLTSIPPGKFLSIKMHLNDGRKSSVVLKLDVMDPGYCSVAMIHHRGNCYHAIGQNLTLNDTLLSTIEQNESAGLRLASFGSLEEIYSFINSSVPPEDVYPTKRPIDLTNPVRIGLFLGEMNREGVHITTQRNSKCALRPAANADGLWSIVSKVTGTCGSLRVNQSGLPSIEFVDCNLQMPALVCFAEVISDTCLNCVKAFSRRLPYSDVKNEENVVQNDRKFLHFLPVTLLSIEVALIICQCKRLASRRAIPNSLNIAQSHSLTRYPRPMVSAIEIEAQVKSIELIIDDEQCFS